MSDEENELKIPLLPNLMTAGNLCCGFWAVLSLFHGIREATQVGNSFDFLLAQRYYHRAILLIFGSCVFDLLDGRMARLTGQDSPFGREFDSLADIVSFGMAPAILIAKAVLFELPDKVGWAIALIYLLCGAMRLARFNCLAVMPKKDKHDHDFTGIPIPMAAGFIASLTMLIINNEQNAKDMGNWKYVLAAAMFGLSILMMSKVKYPSFKKVDFSFKGSQWLFLGIAIVAILTVKFRYHAPAALFSLYLLYGLVRPLISKKLRHDIELDDEEENETQP